MPDNYRGISDDKSYTGEYVNVTYNLKRCIHASECVNNLPQVFDRDKRPWITPDFATPEALLDVILNCPSGALHILRKDGGAGEPIPETNIITLLEDGYLRMTGNLWLEAAGVDLQGETRLALCRCGASLNKPFCDNAHLQIGFRASTPAPQTISDGEPITLSDKLQIIATTNGSYAIKGPYEIRSADGTLIERGEENWLCRCGHSQNKPFCDGSHRRVGFKAP